MPLLRAAFAALLVLTLLAGCAGGKRLDGKDRAQLGDAKAIHVLHYDTALPQVRSSEANAPTPAAVRKFVAADPAAQTASQFSRLLVRQEKLRNLQAPQTLARPVAGSAREFRDRLQGGLALEVWADDWQIGPAPGEPKNYALTMTMQARLSRVDTGRRLWTADACRTSSAREHKLTLADLTQGMRLRKALTAARDECARQFLRDFAQRPGN